ncbi:MAG: TadE family protein [Anaerolineales bacterium]
MMTQIPKPIITLFQNLRRSKHPRAQSLLELALILPVLLIMLLGLAEVAVFIGRYLDLLDLTREAARFASVRDPFTVQTDHSLWDCGPAAPGTEIPFDFYYSTSCVFSPPRGSSLCYSPKFCNGLNSFVAYNPATDDIVISVYTVTNDLDVTNVWPAPKGYWAFSDYDSDTLHNANWKKDCQGNEVRTTPYYNEARVEEALAGLAAVKNKGFVAVEYYFCYEQLLGLPIVTNLIPNPLRIHVYTLMPLPAAQPSPTPKTP